MYRQKEVPVDFPLTKDQIEQKSAEYFMAKDDLERVTDILEEAKRQYKYDSEPFKKIMSDLWQSIKTGKETRTVWAIEIPDEDRGVVNLCDPQNPDVVWQTREMTPAEKTQYRIDFTRQRRREILE